MNKSEFVIEEWNKDLSTEWDRALPSMAQGTFIHSRRFLSYHGERLIDRSVIIRGSGGDIRAIFPAALSNNDPTIVISHPGTTHAGLLHSDKMRADDAILVWSEVLNHYKSLGVRQLHVKSVPQHLHRVQSGFEQWLLWKNGGVVHRVDLWNVIDLLLPIRISNGTKDNIRKASKGNIRLVRGTPVHLGMFFDLLVENLRERHNVRPTHELAEIEMIWSMFSQEIILHLAFSSEGDLLAGVLLFLFSGHAVHAQYIASSDEGRKNGALAMLLKVIIEESSVEGYRYFSFGASTDDKGYRLNSGLFNFKAGFGPATVPAQHVLLDL